MKYSNNFFVILSSVFLFFVNTNVVFSQQTTTPELEVKPKEPPFLFRDDQQLYIALGFSDKSGLSRFDLGIEGDPPGWPLGIFLDLSLLMQADAVKKGQDALWGTGFSFGLRTTLGWIVEPYAGGGVFIGSNGDTAPAENDNLDNDEDGSIDEDGESKRTNSALVFGVKGEVGVRLRLGSLRLLVGYHNLGFGSSSGQSASDKGIFLMVGMGNNFFK